MQTVALIDYGSGNLRSAQNALERAASAAPGGAKICVTADPETVAAADRVVLPGVGAFAACREALMGRAGLVEAITAAVQGRGVPFLGVCVGMQLLASRGLEFGETPGLDWIPGEVRRLTPAGPTCKVPHMGWNSLDDISPSGTALGLVPDAAMYFTHSFAFHPADPADVAAFTDHGGRFPAAVLRGNLAGVQFHPEKSQSAGLSLLARFLEWRP
jgi:glutamine amidotransferase